MTNADILDWVALIGRTRRDQVRTLYDMLTFAEQDEMSAADLAICRRAVVLLGGRPPAPLPPGRRPTQSTALAFTASCVHSAVASIC